MASLKISGEPPFVGPENYFFMKDDFAAGTASTGFIGELGWSLPAGAIAVVNHVAGHPGIYNLSTTTTIATLARIHPKANSTYFQADTDQWKNTWIFQLNTNDTDTQVRIGVSDNPAGDSPGSGAWLDKAYADTSWFAVTGNGTLGTRVSMGAIDTNWHKLRIRRITSTSFGFTLDAGAETVINNDHPPANAEMCVMQIKNQTATAKTINIDYFDFQISGLAR